jgi:hypothetical protein
MPNLVSQHASQNVTDDNRNDIFRSKIHAVTKELKRILSYMEKGAKNFKEISPHSL